MKTIKNRKLHYNDSLTLKQGERETMKTENKKTKFKIKPNRCWCVAMCLTIFIVIMQVGISYGKGFKGNGRRKDNGIKTDDRRRKDDNRLAPPPAYLDFGDALKFAYPTTLAQNGARHSISNNCYVSYAQTWQYPDPELDGFFSYWGDGDDTDNLDDEDVIFPVLEAGRMATLDVYASVDGYLSLWIDWDGGWNWAWSGPDETIFVSKFVVAGMNTISFAVPVTAFQGETFARLRFSTDSSSVATYTGYAPDGEVEDHLVYIIPPQYLDYGDAPTNNYPTTLAQNGARHSETNAAHISSAQTWAWFYCDRELDGIPSPYADGDDYDGWDDEDVIFPVFEVGGIATLDVFASEDGYLSLWIDWIPYDCWAWSDPADTIFVSKFVPAGTNAISFAVPLAAVPGGTFARLRFSTDSSSVVTYTGCALDGEVEDHFVKIIPPQSSKMDYGDAACIISYIID